MNKVLGNKLVITLLVLPALLLFTIFIVFPLIPTVIASLQKTDGIVVSGFVGLDNFKKMFKDPVMWASDLNSFKVVAANVLVGMPLSLLLALFINEQGKKVRNFVKVGSFIPAVLSITVICQMWRMILQPRWGILDSLLKMVGLNSLITNWLTNPNTALNAVIVTFLWQYIGYNMVLFYAGIKSIPEKYYEACLLEGANFFHRNWYITLPLLQETIKFVTILSVLGSVSMFGQVSIMTNGGPGDISRTIVFHMFNKAFVYQDFGGGNAIAIFIALQGLLLIIFMNRILAKKRIEYI